MSQFLLSASLGVMSRTARASKGGICYHVMNRGNARATVYHDADDYEHFVYLIRKACVRISMRVLAYCLMPNHFHMVLWPYRDGDLSRWMHWLLTAHVRHYHRKRGSSGRVWQGRFKAFPLEQDRHLLVVLRYVERNPVRANLVTKSRDWCWSSASASRRGPRGDFLCASPVEKPRHWRSWVDQPHGTAELESLRRSSNKGTPFGNFGWILETARDLGLDSTLRDPGRPRH